MRKHNRRWLAPAALALTALLLCSCGQKIPQGGENAPGRQTTLRILLRGTAAGLDRVLEALYSQMDETHSWKLSVTLIDSSDYPQQLSNALTAHEDYDLVFDAQWMTLTAFAEQGKYLNLEDYFLNPDYPGLQAAFSEEYLNANLVDGELYAIPFTNSYYDPPGFFYRRDLLRSLDLGFDSITTREDLLAFWEAVQEEGSCKPVVLGSRGFYQFNLPEVDLRQYNIWDVDGWSFWDYPSKVLLSADGSTVLDAVFPGDDDERFAALPEPFTANFLDAYLVANAESGVFLDPNDVLTQDGKTAFLAGLSASCEGSLGSGGSSQLEKQMEQAVPEAEIGFFAYDKAFAAENLAPGGVPTGYSAWNYLCVPAYSQRADEAMAFLDWLYSDWGRVDLFNYGVEGVDWVAEGDDGYVLLSNPEGAFSFPSYEIAWNPLHQRIDSTLSGEEQLLLEYIYDPESYRASPFAGFRIRTTPVGAELSLLNALYEEYSVGFSHGAYGEHTQEKIDELHERSVAVGLETVREEIVRQLQAFLDTREG